MVPGLLPQNVMMVLAKLYLQRDILGSVIETPEEMFRRVAKNVAQADRNYLPQTELACVEEEFYLIMTMLDSFPILPLS